MDIATSPIQSYQKNQNLAGWVEQTEKNQAVTESPTEQPHAEDDAVFIGEATKVYQWMAQEFPQPFSKPATLNRLNQALFSYGLFSMSDVGVVNQLQSHQPAEGIRESLREKIESSQSFVEQQTLKHISQVYETVVAATEAAAA